MFAQQFAPPVTSYPAEVGQRGRGAQRVRPVATFAAGPRIILVMVPPPMGEQMTAYAVKPDPFLIKLHSDSAGAPKVELSCIGFDGGNWRDKGFVNYLFNRLSDYALDDEELKTFNHASGWAKLREAAVRIYSTEHAEDRGEIGEISLHAVCREYFDTIPLVPRIFYLSASNDVVKGFDLVHFRTGADGAAELWLGESKFYQDRGKAISDAIASVRKHLDHNFLKKEKLLIGPQISKSNPHYEEIRALFKDGALIDELKRRAVFPIGILAESAACASYVEHCPEYISEVKGEVAKLAASVVNSGLASEVDVVLIYIPIKSRKELIEIFDKKLKAIQDD